MPAFLGVAVVRLKALQRPNPSTNDAMLLYRLGPEGFFAATDEEGQLRFVYSDPFLVEPGGWEFGRVVESGAQGAMVPIHPGKIIGIGRNYRAHAEELGNPVPEEPVMFLKAPRSIGGPQSAGVLPSKMETNDRPCISDGTSTPAISRNVSA